MFDFENDPDYKDLPSKDKAKFRAEYLGNVIAKDPDYQALRKEAPEKANDFAQRFLRGSDGEQTQFQAEYKQGQAKRKQANQDPVMAGRRLSEWKKVEGLDRKPSAGEDVFNTLLNLGGESNLERMMAAAPNILARGYNRVAEELQFSDMDTPGELETLRKAARFRFRETSPSTGGYKSQTLPGHVVGAVPWLAKEALPYLAADKGITKLFPALREASRFNLATRGVASTLPVAPVRHATEQVEEGKRIGAPGLAKATAWEAGLAIPFSIAAEFGGPVASRKLQDLHTHVKRRWDGRNETRIKNKVAKQSAENAEGIITDVSAMVDDWKRIKADIARLQSATPNEAMAEKQAMATEIRTRLDDLLGRISKQRSLVKQMEELGITPEGTTAHIAVLIKQLDAINNVVQAGKGAVQGLLSRFPVIRGKIESAQEKLAQLSEGQGHATPTAPVGKTQEAVRDLRERINQIPDSNIRQRILEQLDRLEALEANPPKAANAPEVLQRGREVLNKIVDDIEVENGIPKPAPGPAVDPASTQPESLSDDFDVTGEIPLWRRVWDDESGQATFPLPGRPERHNSGLSDDARAVMQGIDTERLGSREAALLNDVVKAIRENRPIVETVKKHDDGPEYSSLGDLASGYLKATLLAAFTVVAKNVESNTLYQGFRGAAHYPSAMMDNWIAGGNGRRVVEGASFQQLARVANQAARQGAKEAGAIMKDGVNPNRMAQLDGKRELRFKNAVLNVLGQPVNYVFRAMAAGDRVNWQASYIRSLESQARFLAQALAKGDKKMVAELTEQGMNDPILQAEAAFAAFQARAAKAADFATFNNPNGASQWAEGMRKDPLGRVAVEAFTPFVRVPANYFHRQVDATPIIGWMRSGEAGRKVTRAFVMQFKDKEAAASILQTLTREEQEAVTRLFGEGLVGTAFTVIGGLLYAKGMVSPGYDSSDARLDTEEGQSAGSLKVNGNWRPIEGMGVGGDMLVLGASLVAAATHPEGMTAERMLAVPMSTIANHPVADYSKEVANALTNYKTAAPKIAGEMGRRLVPNFVGQIAQATDDYERSIRPDPRTKGMVDKGAQYFLNGARKMIPGQRQELPIQRTPMGVPVPSNRARGIQPQPSIADRSNDLTREMRSLGMQMDYPEPEIENQKLSHEEYSAYQREARFYVEEELDRLLTDPGYQDLTRSQKIKAFRDAVNAGRKRARQDIAQEYQIEKEDE